MPGSCASGSLYVGIDGGGSRCRVRVVDGAGHLVSSAEGGSANVYLDFENALAVIERTVEVACSSLGPSAQCHAGIGLAGVSSPAVATRVATRLQHAFGRLAVTNDAVIACLGAHAGADGGIVIAGTGSGAVLRLNGSDTNFGGRGFLLGDDGSGAVVGRQAWRRALRALDGMEPRTALLSDLLSRFADDPVAVIAWGRQATSAEFAAFAPQILAAAAIGDAAALAIAVEAGRAIAELATALVQRGAPRVSLVGGLASALGPHLPEDTRMRLSPPLLDALDGALLLAGAPVATSDRTGGDNMQRMG
nr:BadF/BadG/BcrA/BcrD ATPase family protein [Lichenifustis flavocetrariae]